MQEPPDKQFNILGDIMAEPIKVAILDRNQSFVFSYLYCLKDKENVEVIGSVNYAEELFPFLAENPIDVLITGINFPTSRELPNLYPVHILIPKLLEKYPDLIILVISNQCHSVTIKAIMEAGARGYILKEDNQSICNLGEIIQTVYSGDVHFSQEVFQTLFQKFSTELPITTRQLQALTLCATYPGETTADLASRLGIADSTFRNLLSRTYLKLGVRNRTSAITEARRKNLIPPDTPTNPPRN